MDCLDLWMCQYARDQPFDDFQPWPLAPTVSEDETIPAEGVRRYFFRDYTAFKGTAERSRWTQDLIQVHAETRIPDALLTGPWNEGDVQKLFWLVWAGARLAASQTWELTTEGFVNATAMSNTRSSTIIRIFLELSVFAEWPGFIMRQQADRIKDGNLFKVMEGNGAALRAFDIINSYPWTA